FTSFTLKFFKGFPDLVFNLLFGRLYFCNNCRPVAFCKPGLVCYKFTTTRPCALLLVATTRFCSLALLSLLGLRGNSLSFIFIVIRVSSLPCTCFIIFTRIFFLLFLKLGKVYSLPSKCCTG